MYGMMSHTDIINAMKNGELAIAPFDFTKPDKRLTPAGFNFSFTKFIISLNKKEPCKLYENKAGEIYFTLDSGDSALALTRETIWVSGKYAGTFHSKVGFAAKGLGQISTTLDPGWRGQLLISINNPNAKPVKVVIGKYNEKKEIDYETFITLCLYELKTPAINLSDNISGRLDLIHKTLQQDGTSQGDTDQNVEKQKKEKLERLKDQLVEVINKERELEKEEKLSVLELTPLEQETRNDTLKRYNHAHDRILAMFEKLAPEIQKDYTTTG